MAKVELSVGLKLDLLKIILIENEVAALAQLKELVSEYLAEAKIVGTAGSINAGIALIREQQPDIVFLDVELDDGLSFDILRAFPNPSFLVVFCTAFEHYAMSAIRMSAVDFLLKPIEAIDFSAVVNKLHTRLYQKQQLESQAQLLQNLYAPVSEQKIILRDAQHLYFLYPRDLMYVQAEGRYSLFFSAILPEGKLLISQNLRVYEELLTPHHFFRCHHSHLVNLNNIVRVDKASSSLLLENGTAIPISQRKRDKLIKKLKEISI